MKHYAVILKQQMAEMYNGACVSCALKAPTSFIMGTVWYLVGGQNKSAVTAVIVLLAIDLVTAIMAKFKIGEPIESRKALKTATKTVTYGLFLAGAHLTEMIVPGTTFLDEAALSFLALTELISIIENIGKMGYAVPQKLLNRLVAARDDK